MAASLDAVAVRNLARQAEGMADLVYSTQCSLDLRLADEHGDFSWAFPADDVHRHANALAAAAGTHVLGRRTYEVMGYWDEVDDDASEVAQEFQRAWAPAEKIVISRSLDEDALGPNARIVREFDPASIRELTRSGSADVTIGGAELGGQALAAGIVDVLDLVLFPVIVGNGPRVIADGVRVQLELESEQRFASGPVGLRYRVLPPVG